MVENNTFKTKCPIWGFQWGSLNIVNFILEKAFNRIEKIKFSQYSDNLE